MQNETYKRVQIELNDSISLEMFGYLIQPPQWQGDLHSHPFWELVYIRKGGGTVYFGNQEDEFTFCTGWLFPPGVHHRFVNTVNQRVEHLYIGFSFELSVESEQGVDFAAMRLTDLSGGTVIEKKLQELSEFLRQFPKEYSLRLKQEQVFEILVGVIKLIAPSSLTVNPGKNMQWMIQAEKAKRHLEANLHRSVSVREVAGLFYLSPHYFGETFKKSTGMSIKEYHNSLRMTKAARLIQENELNITEIAETLGFESIHYFSRKFKQFHNVSPANYRKKDK